MLWLGCLNAAWATPQVPVRPEAVSGPEAKQWLNWAIPLPKEVALERKVTLSADRVRLTLRDGATSLEKSALRCLQDLFRDKAGVDSSPANSSFEILLGVCNAQGRVGDVTVADAGRLTGLPNREQAYLIRSVGDNRLVLTALDARGVFYAALTLGQLLESRFVRESVALPLAEITDWPDMAERGEWGFITTASGAIHPDDIERLSACKMNLLEFQTQYRVEEDGRAVVDVDRSLLRRGHARAVNMVPIITHLNGLGRPGIGGYRVYPELRGKGLSAVVKSRAAECAPCASNPKLVELLADWMRGFATYEPVTDVCCYLSETSLHCECETCAGEGVGQFALEARAFVNAWRLAVKDFPKLRTRILLTQGSYSTNDKVLAEIPPEVGVTYYDGARTYDSSPEPMIYPLLEDFAAQGRWLGVYPQLTPSWRIVSPWSGPQFIKTRMTEFVDKKVTSLAGYVVGGSRLFDFNLTASAEWSWNAHGRDEAEFATAWATRRGMTPAHAALAADWAVKLGQAAWDIYGARLVERYLFRPANLTGMISAGTPPNYGAGMLKYIPNAEHLEGNLSNCRQALALAERIGHADMLAESKAILTYYQIVREIASICTLLGEGKSTTKADVNVLQHHMNRLALAGLLNVRALRDWERPTGGLRGPAGGRRLAESRKATLDAVNAVATALKRFGIRDPVETFRPSTEIGGWKTGDFQEEEAIEMSMDVTELISGPGRYQLTFQYTKGWYGLRTQRAALVSAQPDNPEKRTELAVDEHPGHARSRSYGNVYQLNLPQHDPALRYFIVARVRGTSPRDMTPERTGCGGKVWLEREIPLDWQFQIMTVAPGAEVEPKLTFSGTGLKVGVVAGGYGSEGILELLRKTKGLDAAPVGIGSFASHNCRILVFPQMRYPTSEAHARTVEEFARNGGGVITTHDAVGYRRHPKIFESVCGGGVARTRSGTWQTAGNHPVTKGLPVGRALSRGYYDQVEMQNGVDGTVVAVGQASKAPVIVVGPFGKGRYVACGLLLGMEHDPFGGGSREAPPAPDEAGMLLNAIDWCAGNE